MQGTHSQTHTHTGMYVTTFFGYSPLLWGVCCHHFGFNNTKISGEALTLATANYSNTRSVEGWRGAGVGRTLQVDLPVYDNYALGTPSFPLELPFALTYLLATKPSKFSGLLAFLFQEGVPGMLGMLLLLLTCTWRERGAGEGKEGVDRNSSQTDACQTQLADASRNCELATLALSPSLSFSLSLSVSQIDAINSRTIFCVAK